MNSTRPSADLADSHSGGSQNLFTFKSGGWVLLIAGILTLFAAGLVLYPVWSTGGFHPPVGDGQHVDTYGFDLSNLTIPPSHLIAFKPKDQIRAIPEKLVETITPAEVDLIAKNEHIRFLVPKDRVIGISLNGESRAYPLRVLNLHELVNDTLGGIPIAVTYSPLCDSVVVFDRRIHGASAPAAEFGISGLLVDSNSVFFDRESKANQESLWPQLALKAVSGPSAGKPMQLIPYDLVSWKDWSTAHPDTHVLLGLRTLKQEYGSEPYNTYLADDNLRFPVNPEWFDAKVPHKTSIVITSAADNRWIATFPSATAPATLPASAHRIYSFVFAWYAQHPHDTDYSALLK